MTPEKPHDFEELKLSRRYLLFTGMVCFGGYIAANSIGKIINTVSADDSLVKQIPSWTNDQPTIKDQKNNPAMSGEVWEMDATCAFDAN